MINKKIVHRTCKTVFCSSPSNLENCIFRPGRTCKTVFCRPRRTCKTRFSLWKYLQTCIFCLWSKPWPKIWQKHWTITCFERSPPSKKTKMQKPSVLLYLCSKKWVLDVLYTTLKSQTLINCGWQLFFANKVAFLVKILVRECKQRKKVKKPLFLCGKM